MGERADIIKSRKALRKLYIKYGDELHNIIEKIDKMLEKMQ